MLSAKDVLEKIQRNEPLEVDAETVSALSLAIKELLVRVDKLGSQPIARRMLLERVTQEKRALLEELESGERNFTSLRARLENYIDLQTAADRLGGY